MEASIRARKKAATRLAISDVATRLFMEHGYDAVSLAQVAAEADVSIKTILNYFNAKDELYFDRAQEVFDALSTAITERASGTTVIGALRRILADRRVPFDTRGWEGLNDAEGLVYFRAFLAVEAGSSTLHARRLAITEQWTVALADLLVGELDLPRDDPRLESLSAMLLTALDIRSRTLADAVLAGRSPAEIERRTRAIVDDVFARLERAFGELDRRRTAE